MISPPAGLGNSERQRRDIVVGACSNCSTKSRQGRHHGKGGSRQELKMCSGILRIIFIVNEILTMNVRRPGIGETRFYLLELRGTLAQQIWFDASFRVNQIEPIAHSSSRTMAFSGDLNHTEIFDAVHAKDGRRRRRFFVIRFQLPNQREGAGGNVLLQLNWLRSKSSEQIPWSPSTSAQHF